MNEFLEIEPDFKERRILSTVLQAEGKFREFYLFSDNHAIVVQSTQKK